MCNYSKAILLFKLVFSLSYLFAFYTTKVYSGFGLFILEEMTAYLKFGNVVSSSVCIVYIVCI